MRRLGCVRRTTVQLQRDDVSHQQVLSAIFGQNRLNKYTCMTSDEKLTIFATPWAKQFRDDINSLKDLDDVTTLCTT